MAVYNRQYGWSVEEKLLHEITKQLDKAIKNTAPFSESTTTTTTTLPV